MSSSSSSLPLPTASSAHPYTPPHTPLTDPEGGVAAEKQREEVQRAAEQKEGEDRAAAEVQEIVHFFQQHSRSRRPRLPLLPPPLSHDAVVRRCDTTPAALTAALDYVRSHDPAAWQCVHHELRWEYCARTNTLSIRMPPSPFHESICHQVESAVDTRVRCAIETCAALTPETRRKVLARWDTDMQRTRSADVQLNLAAERGRRGVVAGGGDGEGGAEEAGEDGQQVVLPFSGSQLSPDASWRPNDTATPVAVLEVAWSEDVVHWKNKCADYVELDPRSTVRTVLGVKCDYSSTTDLRPPRTRVLLYRRYEEEAEDGTYGLDPWGPRDVSGGHVFHLRFIDFVPWSTARTSPDFQQWSDHIGDIAFPLTLFEDIVRHANLLRQPSAPRPVPTSTRVLGKRRRHVSEETEEEEASATQSFESVEPASTSDSEYRPTANITTLAEVTEISAIPVRRRSARAKRFKYSRDNG